MGLWNHTNKWVLLVVANKIVRYNSKSKEFARKLRKESTLGEVLLWKQIRTKSLGFEFHRQVPIDKYIVDFYCHELLLAIEIDGNSHHDVNKDNERQQRLESLGVRFIRFAERTIKYDMTNVILALEDTIDLLRKQP